MLFSIIIPTYNRSSRIKKTIDSILLQSFIDVEVIVVDDGSVDDTEQVISGIKDSRIKYVKTENRERGAARNTGVTYSTGDYINFFDSDDIMLPCLDVLCNFITTCNNPPIIYGLIEHRDENGKIIKVRTSPYEPFTSNLLFNNFLACGSVFMRRSIAMKFPFHEDRRLSSAEDWELWLRIHAEFAFVLFPNNIFIQVHHKNRSISLASAEKVEQRDAYFAGLIKNNKNLSSFYDPKSLRLFCADRFTFIALNWSSTNKRRAFQFWLKSLAGSASIIKRKRFWAVLKKLLLSW